MSWACVPASATPKGSQERVAALRALTGVETMGPNGRPFTPSVRDIERKVSEAGDPTLSRRWDAATASLDDEAREAIARRVHRRFARCPSTSSRRAGAPAASASTAPTARAGTTSVPVSASPPPASRRCSSSTATFISILEDAFRTIEQLILPPLKGYIGGDRMNARSANLGKAPSPFDSSFDDFAQDFRWPWRATRSGPRRPTSTGST